jgi:hypothetical protein
VNFRRRTGLCGVLGSILLTRWLGSIGIVGIVRVCGFFPGVRFFLNCATVCTFGFFFVLFGERFYEGLISIWSSGSVVGPIV